jgi:hypothetical protein
MLRSILALFLLLPCFAHAQGFAYDPTESLLLKPAEIAGFNRIFSTTADQQHAIASLVTAAQSEATRSEQHAAEILNSYGALPPDRKTADTRADTLARSNAAGPDMPALRKKLLSDLGAVLTAEQNARWKEFEYFLRRERVLHSGSWWADRSNLLAIAAASGADSSTDPSLAALLDSYEHDLDSLLAEIETAQTTLGKELRKARAAQEDIAPIRDTSPLWDLVRRLSRLNLQYSRRIAAQLPKDQAARFRALYDQSSLTEALGPQQSDLAIRAAPDLPGLTEDARAAASKIVSEYGPKYDALTKRIATMERLILDAQPGHKDPQTADWDAVRFERHALVANADESLRAILTPDQFTLMLEQGRRREMEWKGQMSR